MITPTFSTESSAPLTLPLSPLSPWGSGLDNLLFVLMRELVALVILRYSQGNTSRFEELRLGAGGRGLVLSRGGDWRETPGPVQVGALLAKPAGRIPIREVESEPV